MACCSARDKHSILIHPADDSACKLRVIRAAWGCRVQSPTRPSIYASEEQCDDRPKKADQLSDLNEKTDGSEEKAQVPSPKIQEYREVEQLGPAARLATNIVDHSVHADVPLTPLVPLPAEQETPCQPVQESNGGALQSPFVLERIAPAPARPNESHPTGANDCTRAASDLEVPDPPLAAPQEEPSQMSLGDTDDKEISMLPQPPPSKLDGEAKARRPSTINTLSNLSEGLACKFQELRNKEATGESVVGNINEQRNSVFEPAHLEDKLACRFEQQLAKERASRETSVVSVDGSRAARRSNGIAIVDKVLMERLAQQRLKADGH